MRIINLEAADQLCMSLTRLSNIQELSLCSILAAPEASFGADQLSKIEDVIIQAIG